jgi:protein-disulfide isomerase
MRIRHRKLRARSRGGRSRWRIVVLVCVTTVNCYALANAQEKRPNKTDHSRVPRDDVVSLETDLKALEAEQHQIIEQLNEIKGLLSTAAGGRPVSPPPTTLSIQGENFRGNSGASVAMIEYADFECPFCGKYAREVYPKILDEYVKTGKVKLFYRDLPLPMHPHALAAARAARCAGEQGKYWEMHDSLFASQTALSDSALQDRAQTLGLDTTEFKRCLSSGKYADEIQKSLSEAEKLGVRGTPTFFLGTVDPNGDVVKIGKIIVGARPYETFKAALDDLLGSKSQATNSSQ